MAEYRVQISERFVAAFGFVAINAADKLLGNNFLLPEPYVNDDEVLGMSKMGTPLFEKFEFENKTASGTVERYQFEIPPMVDLTIAKRLNVTTLNDATDSTGKIIGGGEVIESWGNESWNITFRGLLVDMVNHKRPGEQIEQVTKLFKIHNVLEIRSSWLFNRVGISSLYIKDLQFPALEGYEDTQPFVIQARSYAPATLEITD